MFVSSNPSLGCGTKKIVVPRLLRAGLGSVRASSSRLSDCAAAVHQILRPLMRQPPSQRSAVVRRAPSRSVPPPGSVTEMAKRSFPSARSGRKRSFCSSLPKAVSDLAPAKEEIPQIHVKPARDRPNSAQSRT